MLRSRFNYSNVVATLALVFAMSGGAYAASKFLISSTKQIKPSVLAQLKGKAGPAGGVGVQGPAGPAGPQGPAGANGKDGSNGTNGKDGAPGLEGKEGKAGKNGSPWTVDGTLPSEATETGTWSFGPIKQESAGTFFSPAQIVPISFAIPLKEPLGAGKVHYVKPGETASAGCNGGTVEKPTAELGNLCVYVNVEEGVTSPHIFDPATLQEGAGKTGDVLVFGITGSQGDGMGTWALTAE